MAPPELWEGRQLSNMLSFIVYMQGYLGSYFRGKKYVVYVNQFFLKEWVGLAKECDSLFSYVTYLPQVCNS